MKRVLILLLTACMLLSFTGCSVEKTKNSDYQFMYDGMLKEWNKQAAKDARVEDLFGFGGAQYQAAPPTEQPGDSELVRQAVHAIRQQAYSAAIAHLQNVVSTQRNARWYYLSGVANHGAGNTIQAVEHMTRACQMDPNNGVYMTLLRQYRQSGQTYQHNAGGHSTTFFDPSRLCDLCCMMQLCCPYGPRIFCC